MKTLLLLAASLTIAQALGASEESLGRLFYSREQRRQLDSLRQQQLAGKFAVDLAEQPIFTIDGAVRRSAGPDTYWRNGTAHAGRLDPASQASIGERLDPRRGTVDKLLGAGSLQIHRPTR